jgi:DNA polymerase-3 subunit delta
LPLEDVVSKTVDALDYLAKPAKYQAAPVCVVFGEEAFLKQLVLGELRREVLGGEDGEFSLARFEGRTCQAREVFDELSTVALFGGGRRLVVVDDADEFVSQNRPVLEDYTAHPKPSGVLVLDVKTWPKTTRLYKALDAGGLQVDCKPPTERSLHKWLISWAGKRHGTKLEGGAAELLVEIVGPELGLLDQELAKLAVSVPPGETIAEKLVRELVGGWRAQTAWEMLDAAAAGDSRSALAQLDRLLLAGENAIGILAQMSASLRRLAAATRLIEQAEKTGRRATLRQALEEAGFKPFVLGKAEQQLKQLGRQRGGQLYRWLLETDLELKGQSSLPPRVQLERLIVRLSSAAGPSRSAS